SQASSYAAEASSRSGPVAAGQLAGVRRWRSMRAAASQVDSCPLARPDIANRPGVARGSVGALLVLSDRPHGSQRTVSAWPSLVACHLTGGPAARESQVVAAGGGRGGGDRRPRRGGAARTRECGRAT